MSTTLTRWRENAIAPLEWAGLLPLLTQEIRVEQYIDEGRFVLRAELPGFDPENDIELTVADGMLRIVAERVEGKHEPFGQFRAHSEFRYGRFVRTVELPSAVKPDTARAMYHNGVLEVVFGMGVPKASGHRIQIHTDSPSHIDPPGAGHDSP